MKTPVILLLVSAVLGFVGLYVLGWSDILLLAVPMGIASILLFVFALGRTSVKDSPKTPKKPGPKRLKRSRRSKRDKASWVIVDGSNVMHWKGGEPKIWPVKELVGLLQNRRFQVIVMFDANAGYLLSGSHQNDEEFSRQLSLPKTRVMVVPKGTPADPLILAAAIENNAKVVTNDRFRDWADDYPEVNEEGFLITGGYRGRELFTSLQ